MAGNDKRIKEGMKHETPEERRRDGIAASQGKSEKYTILITLSMYNIYMYVLPSTHFQCVHAMMYSYVLFQCFASVFHLIFGA